MQASAAEAECHLLEVAADAGQHGPQRQIGNRKIGQHLGGQRAGKPIDVCALETEQIMGDEPTWTERENEGDGRGEWWRDEREEGCRIDEANPPRRQVSARDGEGKEEAQSRAENADQATEEK